MRYSSELESLIFSLSKSEKRQFKMTNGSLDKESKTYIKLFDTIEKSRNRKKQSEETTGDYDTRRYLFQLLTR
ncbi:MAG TPA: hypothetical protein VNX68_12060, partial [Nitrosopumilaceae archaeon]|nr:hypothetical protein [Nitrosopumilaceae archaeon]